MTPHLFNPPFSLESSAYQYSKFRTAVLADGGFIADEGYAFGQFVAFYDHFGAPSLDATLISGLPAGKVSKLYYWDVKTQALGWFTFARAGTKWVLNSAGVLAEVPANVPAFEFNADGTYKGLLVEPAVTNQIRNNSMQGAIAGSPGTLPTNWINNARGLTRTIVGTGVLDGVDYIDIRFNGVATESAGVQIIFESTTQIVAASGQTWTNSVWFQVLSQPTPAASYRITINERTVAGAGVTGGEAILSDVTSWIRRTFTRTLAGGGTVERTTPEINFPVVNGQSYDFTVRIGLPQMEQSPVATSVIKATGSAASRVADSVTLTGASSLIGQTAGTIFAEAELRDLQSSLATRVLQIASASTDRVQIVRNATTKSVDLQVIANNVAIANFNTGVINMAAIHKFALAYESGNCIGAYNGTLPAVDTDAFTFAGSVASIGLGVSFDGTLPFNGWIRTAAIYKTRLSNAQLQTLTTP